MAARDLPKNLDEMVVVVEQVEVYWYMVTGWWRCIFWNRLVWYMNVRLRFQPRQKVWRLHNVEVRDMEPKKMNEKRGECV